LFFYHVAEMTFISKPRQSEAIARSQYARNFARRRHFAASFTTCLRCLSHGARQQVRLHSALSHHTGTTAHFDGTDLIPQTLFEHLITVPPLQFGLQRWGVRLHLFLAGSRGVLSVFFGF
jgi:hypothetical protein